VVRSGAAATLRVFEKHQPLFHRHAPAFIRQVLDSFRQRTLSADQAAEQLSLSPSRLYALATAYNTARARQQSPLWTPGTAGGDQATAWPQPVLDLLEKRLACAPPCPYSFAASEALRLHAFKLDRAQVRRWALANKLAHAVPPLKVLAPVRRWQRAQIGELWQLDASPHRWFPHSKLSFPMLNMQSMIAAACSPARRFMSANSCAPISTSCPPLSWPTDARSNSITNGFD